MNNTRRIAAVLFLVPVFALVAACSTDDLAPAEKPPADGAPVEKPGTPDAAGAYVPNHIILGKTGVQVAPSVQCNIFAENTISVAGVGKSDSGVEFAFDVFDADNTLLTLTTSDGMQWESHGMLSYRVETETRVTGLTELRSMGGDVEPVSFAFSCE